MAANTKIKAAGAFTLLLVTSTRIHLRSAGIAYEKKAKRKDATEEHTRYTTLLSTLGTDMSSAKQSVLGATNYQLKTDVRFAVNMLSS